MHRDEARTIKQRLARLAWELAEAQGVALRASSYGQEGVTAEDVLNAPTLAIGLAPRADDDYGIAVRYRMDVAGAAAVAEQVAVEAGPDADVRRTGRILSLADGPWSGAALPAEPAQGETGRVRPLRPGVSIAHADVTAGTLGAFVTRDGSDRVFVLSNWHVLAGSPSAAAGDAILQPGPADGGTAPEDRVGALADMVPLRPSEPATVDAALALLDDPEVDLAYPVGPISETAEVRGGEQVAKVGRTTGSTTGRVSAVELDDVVVGYGELGTISFDDQIEVESTGAGPFSQGGDSGSLVYREDGVAVGLLFAGSETGGPNGTGLTYVNPIGTVLEVLGVRLATA
ncbi:trypsin-like peptidase domain-containing protein [Georgenia alba]|uniref:Trypsin-like peptidase domain-containing protein n=1 Tax=Georgenia alba TaxID=2233858 RepID=A0ABW2QDZ5_9MICO